MKGYFKQKLALKISTSNQMFGRAVCDKLPECIFESFEIARVKQGQLLNFQKSWGSFIPKIAQAKHWLLINNTKSTNPFY